VNTSQLSSHFSRPY